MADINKLIRENVKALIPYSCARDEFKGKDGIFLDANENPYGSLNRYPDPYQRELKASISKIKGVPEENIFLGNGSDEIIDLCFRIFCNPGIDKALTFTPTYGMYEVSAAINDVILIKIPLSEDFQIEFKSVLPTLKDPALKLIFICSPNNPTGNSMIGFEIESIISGFEGVVVIDEAYIDFSEQQSFKTMINRYSNLIVMQTFSKALGLAAARVGMAFMDPSMVHYFNKMKPPYNISTINQKAALKCLGRIELLKNRVNRIKTERERLAHTLEKMSIIEKVFLSDSNFLLVKTSNADMIYSELIDNKIIVRNRNKMVPGCIRITVGTERENNKLISALQRIKI
ncbi:MAG: histidinol-phosphate transaminase [Bacteroidia bacterium]|jgi:histidinol-phosphate aminotransferase|nr:histidinol-phosphate transaminase [Bacteroidia bacterium]